MTQTQTNRKTVISVTNFIRCGEEYLFIHRTKKGSSVDFGRLNGIGGKVEPGETFIACAIRETAEETGYVVKPEDCQLRAVVDLRDGYAEDWLLCCFVIEVPTLRVPNGMENDEGQLIWLHQDSVLRSGHELVDDINYLWHDIVHTDKLLFFSGKLDQQEKITQHSLFPL